VCRKQIPLGKFGPKKPKVTGGKNFVKNAAFWDVRPCSLAEVVEERNAPLTVKSQKTALRIGTAVKT
jgi:hypothetical protein